MFIHVKYKNIQTYYMDTMRKLILAACMSIMSFSLLNAQIAAIKVDGGDEGTDVEDIIIVFKMHFDIGYTDWAESVLQKYTTSMMDETLQSVEVTDALPKEEKFVWTLPSWPVKHILENVSDARRQGVEKALTDGRFRVHALPFTVETESSDLETLVRGLSYSTDICRKYGQPMPRGAKLTDVPSHSWVLPTLLTQAGVKILHIGCNPGSASPDVPTLFWWEGPDGSRLLTFNWAEYYGSGVLPPEGWKYKTWLAMIHTHENTGAPAPEEVTAVLEEAREKAPQARIRIGQLEDFYDAIMKENPDIPVVRGDMPDTWIHGYMSYPRGVKKNKAVQRLIYNEETLNMQLGQWGLVTEPVGLYVDKAVEQSLLFDEHTFGLAMSHGHQGDWKYGDDFVMDRAMGQYSFIETSWYEKEHRARRAEQFIIPSLRKDLRRLADNVSIDGRKVVVYNPLPWSRSGKVSFHLGVYQKDFQVYGLRDEYTGKVIPAYNSNNLLSFYAEDVPSLGYRSYTVVTSPVNVTEGSLSVDEEGRVLENRYFRIMIDGRSGALQSVWDKVRQREMVDAESGYGFGEYLHEKFGREEIRRYNDAYIKPGHHSWADPEMGRPDNPELEYKMIRGTLSAVRYRKTAHSVSATAFCRTGEGDGYTLTYTLDEDSPYLEICWGINNKPAEPRPEGGWLALPFNVAAPSFRLGRTGGIADPAADFIKNTNRDYCFLNTGMAVIDDKGEGFGLNTPNAPAVSLDRPGLFRFSGDFVPSRPYVFVNLFNNQWGTNFCEWIEGGLSAKVYVWSIGEYDNETSLVTPVEETRVPLMAAYSEGEGGKFPPCAEGIALSEKGVLVTAFAPCTDGDGDILRLWEQAGESRKCRVKLPGRAYRTAQLCNLRGEPYGKPFRIAGNSFTVDLDAYRPVSVLLKR